MVNNGTPTGALMMWATGTAPTGWLLCNGGEISRTTYATLFSVIGTTFGAGNNSTTFNVPDYRDRMPVGAGTLYAVAGIGGSKDAVVVTHTHAVTDPGHRHEYVRYSSFQPQTGSSTPCWYSTASAFTSNAFSNISINEAGETGTNKNMMPYQALHYIIKA